MKKILSKLCIITIMSSCIFSRIDDSIDLGNHYRYVQDYPQAILYHKTQTYKGGGINIVPPLITSYNFNDHYIIAKSIDIYDKYTKYWIVDKTLKGSKVEPLDSSEFYHKLSVLKIDLKL